MWLTRKGAIRAGKGELGIIPGSMGARSYIVRGKGSAASFESCAHGAGRRMSRTAAQKKFSVEDLIEQTSGVICRKDKGVLDEIPGAYKSIDEVMANQADLVEVVHTLKQVLCVKGINRRELLAAGVALPFSGIAYAQLTCGERTAPQTEGPFFAPKSPERRSFTESEFRRRKPRPDRRRSLARPASRCRRRCSTSGRPTTRASTTTAAFRYRGHQFSDARRPLPPRDDRARGVSGRTRHHPRQGAGAGPQHPDDADLLPGDPANRRDSLVPRGPRHAHRSRAKGVSTS